MCLQAAAMVFDTHLQAVAALAATLLCMEARYCLCSMQAALLVSYGFQSLPFVRCMCCSCDGSSIYKVHMLSPVVVHMAGCQAELEAEDFAAPADSVGLHSHSWYVQLRKLPSSFFLSRAARQLLKLRTSC